MIGEYKACDSCCHCILDVYQNPETKAVYKGEPLGCNFSDEERYQTVAQSNGICRDYVSVKTVITHN